MNYTYHEQTCDVYRNEYYGWNTIYNSACGPASLCNALDALKLGSYTVREMCKYSVSVGARGDGGTDMFTLLNAASKKFGFTYRTTVKNAELLQHLKNGGAAIINQGDNYKVFANGGHFVAAVGLASDGKIIVLDSYWTSTKYRTWPAHCGLCTVIERGVVKCSLDTISKASDDRPTPYYLISKIVKKPEPKPEKPKTVKTIEACTARASNGSNSTAVGKILAGQSFTALNETENWVQVPVWIAKKKVTK